MIEYPVKANTRFDIWDTDKGELVAENVKWPRKDGGPIQGADPNIVFLERVFNNDVEVNSFYALGDPVISEVDLVNEKIMREFTTIERPIDEAKERIRDELKHARDTALVSGFDFQGHHFQTRNSQDILNITNVGIASANPAFETYFIAEDNIPVYLNAESAQQFYMTMVLAGQQIWATFAERSSAITNAETIEELQTLVTSFNS